MSEIWIPAAAGGGADLDVVTAQAGDVLQDKVIVGPDGESLTGTMPNRGNYNGQGNSKGNDTGNQRMWVKIPQGYYNENAQVFLSWADIRQMAGIRPEVIKKNVSIIGITGSWEGWVPEPTDLYYKGVVKDEIIGRFFHNNIKWELERILINNENVTDLPICSISKPLDVTSYSQLILEGNLMLGKSSLVMSFNLKNSSFDNIVSEVSFRGNTTKVSFNISQLSTIPSNSSLRCSGVRMGSYINRIRLA